MVFAAFMGNCAKQWKMRKRIADFGASLSMDRKEIRGSWAWGKMIAKRKLAAHQIGVCWSLPAQTMQDRGEEELSGKGTKLFVKGALALHQRWPCKHKQQRRLCSWTTHSAKQLLRWSSSPQLQLKHRCLCCDFLWQHRSKETKHPSPSKINK